MEFGILPDADEEKMVDTICTNWTADFLRSYEGDEPNSVTDRTVLQGDGDQFALINADWRYVRTTGGEEQLYDIGNDPSEHTNLAANSEFEGQLESFRQQLPTEFAEPGLRPKDRDRMRLVIDGLEFRWEAVGPK